MWKKVLFVTFFSVIMVFASNVFAGNMSDYSIDPDICRFSDHVDETNNLPYVRISAGRTEVDADVNKSGIIFSKDDVSISNNMSKVQLVTTPNLISLTGSVEHSFLASQNVSINGKVTGTTFVFSTTTNIGENAEVEGDLIVFSAKVNVEGNVKGNLIIISSDVTVGKTANVSGSIRMTADTIKIDDEAEITGIGYAKYSTSNTISDKFKDVVSIIKAEESGIDTTKVAIPVISIVLTSLILAGIYLLISNNSKIFDTNGELLNNSIAKVIISGFIYIFAFPLVLILGILLTLLGLPTIGISILIIYFGVLILAIIFRIFVTTVIITRYMLKTNYAKFFDSNLKKFVLFAIVYIILSLVEYIPVVGSYLAYFFGIITAGIFVTLTLLRKTLNKQK